MSKSEMRFLRREIINKHLWIVKPLDDKSWWLAGRLDNLTLCVRLYEKQFYGQELKAYAS